VITCIINLEVCILLQCNVLTMWGSWGRINDIEAKYYADSEDAYDMRKMLKIKSEKAGGISLSLILF
jgi:hypothetical protein